MPVDAEQIRRVVIWNRLWLSLLVAAGAAWTCRALIGRIQADVRQLRVAWTGDGLALYSQSDGPFVVTHLVRWGAHDSEKAVARLPEPIAIIDSRGALVGRDTYEKLIWRNTAGDPVPAPPVGAPVGALYYRPEATDPPAGPRMERASAR
jgi:hypothetical protein